MNIYLVRHGEKEKKPGDSDLTEKGMYQAKKTAIFFKSKNVSKIISSPLLRTKHTAQIISKSLKLNINIDRKLLERANWDGDISFNNFLSEWLKNSKNRESKSKIGDTSKNTGKKIEKVINNLKEINQNIILVSHGGTITDFLRNIYSDDYLIKIYFKNIENLYNCTIPECSITQLILKNNKYKLEKICNTKHLQSIK